MVVLGVVDEVLPGEEAALGAARSQGFGHNRRKLDALGWHMDAHAYDILEEAQARGETTLFLDYLGVNPNSRMPLVVVDHVKAGRSERTSPATLA